MDELTLEDEYNTNELIMIQNALRELDEPMMPEEQMVIVHPPDLGNTDLPMRGSLSGPVWLSLYRDRTPEKNQRRRARLARAEWMVHVGHVSHFAAEGEFLARPSDAGEIEELTFDASIAWDHERMLQWSHRQYNSRESEELLQRCDEAYYFTVKESLQTLYRLGCWNAGTSLDLMRDGEDLQLTYFNAPLLFRVAADFDYLKSLRYDPVLGIVTENPEQIQVHYTRHTFLEAYTEWCYQTRRNMQALSKYIRDELDDEQFSTVMQILGAPSGVPRDMMNNLRARFGHLTDFSELTDSQQFKWVLRDVESQGNFLYSDFVVLRFALFLIREIAWTHFELDPIVF